MEKFNTSDDFFAWYIPELKKYIPNLEEMVVAERQGEFTKMLPDLDDYEIESLFLNIRGIVELPEDVFLVYSKTLNTYASRYNTAKKRLEIIIPKFALYHIHYDPVIKAAIQHEMGHILNRDYKFDSSGGHGACSNRCMDIRINHHIDRDDLRDLFNAVYYFRATNFPMLVPEEILPAYGLPMKKSGTYSFDVIHKYYHLNDMDKPKPKPKPPKEYEQPKVGDIVRVDATASYGKVIAIKDGKSVVEKMTMEEVNEHFKKMKEEGGYTPMK
jgi:hypothetical protein